MGTPTMGLVFRARVWRRRRIPLEDRSGRVAPYFELANSNHHQADLNDSDGACFRGWQFRRHEMAEHAPKYRRSSFQARQRVTSTDLRNSSQLRLFPQRSIAVNSSLGSCPSSAAQLSTPRTKGVDRGTLVPREMRNTPRPGRPSPRSGSSRRARERGARGTSPDRSEAWRLAPQQAIQDAADGR